MLEFAPILIIIVKFRTEKRNVSIFPEYTVGQQMLEPHACVHQSIFFFCAGGGGGRGGGGEEGILLFCASHERL